MFQADGQQVQSPQVGTMPGMCKEQEGGPCAGIRVSKQKRGTENKTGGAVYIGFPRTREGPGWNGDSLEQFRQITDPVKTLCL